VTSPVEVKPHRATAGRPIGSAAVASSQRILSGCAVLCVLCSARPRPTHHAL